MSSAAISLRAKDFAMKNLFDHADIFAAADSDLNALAAPDLPVADLELAPADPGAPAVDQRALTPFAIKTITGTDGDDSLAGIEHNDLMLGFGGNDILQGSPGSDILNGGDGFDTTSYFDAPSAVRVDLASPLGGVGDAAGDSFISIEAFQLSSFDDIFIGSGSASETVFGGDGLDVIEGGSGDDQLNGDDGGDILDGGPGNGRLVGAFGRDVLD